MSVIQTTDGDDLVSVGLHTQAGRTDCKTSGRRGGEVMWSDEPPKEDGTYWLKCRGTGIEMAIDRTNRDWETGSELWTSKHYQFGPRIPTPEEMVDNHQTFNEALKLICKLRRELAELKKGGG